MRWCRLAIPTGARGAPGVARACQHLSDLAVHGPVAQWVSYHAFADAGSACRTAFGSAAYHWAPGNGLLVVDRLPMALWLKLPVRGTAGLRNTRWWAVLGLFGAAKLMVLADHPVFDALGFVSGDTLKHLLAAAAALCLLRAAISETRQLR